MSYHNNNNYGNGGGSGYNRGGFRNNNGYNNNGYNNGGYNGGGGGHNNFHFHNGQRINEHQVPQSKHTIFIRGLGGEITTETIQDFVADKIGKISFDFVKMTQDKSKIFVAIRFEKRDEAKEFMETYADREILGYRCELTWFRDIRRYCAYQRSKQVRNNNERRRRRSDSQDSQEEKRSESPPARRRRASRSRDRSEARSRSNSRSQSRTSKSQTRSATGSPNARKQKNRTRSDSKNSHVSRSRSRSESSRRSESSGRSRSASSRRSERSERSASRASSGRESRADSSRNASRDVSRDASRTESRPESRTESRNTSRNTSRDDKKSEKRRRESIEEEKPKKKKSQKLPQIPLPTSTPSPVSSTNKATPNRRSTFMPPPMDMEIESPPTNPYADYQQQQQHNFKNYQMKIDTNVSYSVPMEEEGTPTMIVRKADCPQNSAPPPPPPPPPCLPTFASTASNTGLPAFVPRQVGKIEILMPASLPVVEPVAPVTPAPPPPSVSASVPAVITANGSTSVVSSSCISEMVESASSAQFPTTNKMFGHLKAFQSALLSTVRFEAPAKKEDDGDDLTSLRLSTMVGDDDSEEVKAMEREEKLSKLNDEQMMRFHIKKKQFETAFRNDCETYSVVTRALLSKDESLQFGLKMALLENMEDLYKKMMKRVDDQLDALLAA